MLRARTAFLLLLLLPAAAGSAAAREVFTGRAVLPGGAPAAGAVVVTSAGGQAVAGANGDFELAVELAPDVGSVRVTAVAAPSGAGSLVGSISVAPLARQGATPVGRIALAAASSCQPSWLPTFGGALGVDQEIRSE